MFGLLVWVGFFVVSVILNSVRRKVYFLDLGWVLGVVFVYREDIGYYFYCF